MLQGRIPNPSILIAFSYAQSKTGLGHNLQPCNTHNTVPPPLWLAVHWGNLSLPHNQVNFVSVHLYHTKNNIQEGLEAQLLCLLLHVIPDSGGRWHWVEHFDLPPSSSSPCSAHLQIQQCVWSEFLHILPNPRLCHIQQGTYHMTFRWNENLRFTRLSLPNISCGTCLCCHWFFPPCSSQQGSYSLEPSCGALHRSLACLSPDSLDCHIISGFLASACISAGVQGKQHIPVHLAGESCLLLCQRHHPGKADQKAEGGQGEDQPPVWLAQDRLIWRRREFSF